MKHDKARANFSPNGVFVAFDEWIGQRTSIALGTNAGAQPLAFQNWRRFKEAFAPELIERAVRETSSALRRGLINRVLNRAAR